jgi:hypothetical protein
VNLQKTHPIFGSLDLKGIARQNLEPKPSNGGLREKIKKHFFQENELKKSLSSFPKFLSFFIDKKMI